MQQGHPCVSTPSQTSISILFCSDCHSVVSTRKAQGSNCSKENCQSQSKQKKKERKIANHEFHYFCDSLLEEHNKRQHQIKKGNLISKRCLSTQAYCRSYFEIKYNRIFRKLCYFSCENHSSLLPFFSIIQSDQSTVIIGLVISS